MELDIQILEGLIGFFKNASVADAVTGLFALALVHKPTRARLVRFFANGGNGIYATKAELAAHQELDAKHLAEFRDEVNEKFEKLTGEVADLKSTLNGFMSGFTAAQNHQRRADDTHNRRASDKK